MVHAHAEEGRGGGEDKGEEKERGREKESVRGRYTAPKTLPPNTGGVEAAAGGRQETAGQCKGEWGGE